MFTTDEAANVDRSVNSMCGVEAYGRLHMTYSSRTMGRLFRMQRECMYPKAVRELSGLRSGDHELGGEMEGHDEGTRQ